MASKETQRSRRRRRIQDENLNEESTDAGSDINCAPSSCEKIEGRVLRSRAKRESPKDSIEKPKTKKRNRRKRSKRQESEKNSSSQSVTSADSDCRQTSCALSQNAEPAKHSMNKKMKKKKATSNFRSNSVTSTDSDRQHPLTSSPSKENVSRSKKEIKKCDALGVQWSDATVRIPTIRFFNAAGECIDIKRDEVKSNSLLNLVTSIDSDRQQPLTSSPNKENVSGNKRKDKKRDVSLDVQWNNATLHTFKDAEESIDTKRDTFDAPNSILNTPSIKQKCMDVFSVSNLKYDTPLKSKTSLKNDTSFPSRTPLRNKIPYTGVKSRLNTPTPGPSGLGGSNAGKLYQTTTSTSTPLQKGRKQEVAFNISPARNVTPFKANKFPRKSTPGPTARNRSLADKLYKVRNTLSESSLLGNDKLSNFVDSQPELKNKAINPKRSSVRFRETPTVIKRSQKRRSYSDSDIYKPGSDRTEQNVTPLLTHSLLQDTPTVDRFNVADKSVKTPASEFITKKRGQCKKSSSETRPSVGDDVGTGPGESRVRDAKPSIGKRLSKEKKISPKLSMSMKSGSFKRSSKVSEKKAKLLGSILSSSAVASAISLAATSSTNTKPLAGKTSSAKKPPNFALIHQRQFERMENIVDWKERKQGRAKILLSERKQTEGNKSIRSNAEKSNRSDKIKEAVAATNGKPEPTARRCIHPDQPGPSGLRTKTPREPNVDVPTRDILPDQPGPSGLRTKTPREPNVDVPTRECLTSIENRPWPSLRDVKSSNKTVKRVAFSKIPKPKKVDLEKVVRKDAPVKRAEEKTKENRILLNKVRSNRRFDLLMKMRNKI